MLVHLRDGQPGPQVGPDVALVAPNPYATQDDVAAALRDTAEVHATVARTTGPTRRHGRRARAADHARRRRGSVVGAAFGPVAAGRDAGGTEETTTGLARLRAMDLAVPVIAVNEARAEKALNDRFGTGQS